MSAGLGKPGAPSKFGHSGLTTAAPNNQALLLDKLNVRMSTPDSEALASSDEEAESLRQERPPPPVQPHKPVRRSSWLNDASQGASRPRNSSFASSSMSPTASHPSTPLAESGASAWGTHPASASGVLNRGQGAAPSFPWTTAIWNNDKKEPPSRLAEVLPSPTSSHPAHAVASFLPASGDATLQQLAATSTREPGANSQIPFAIPLHPTPKTYRSQSYSVGQLESDANAQSQAGQNVAGIGARGRTMASAGLQHRPSRPSMLSEMSSDGSMLGKVNEDEDDEEAGGSLQGSQLLQSAEAKKIELLTRENAMLRQQQQYQAARLRPRASTAAAYALNNGYVMQNPVPEESDYAIDEADEANDGTDLSSRRTFSRRMSEFGTGPTPYRSPPLTMENRNLENVKRALWQSSLGFGGVGDMSQSRRHSFADVQPTRQTSISSIQEQLAAAQDLSSHETPQAHDFPSINGTNAVSSYFAGGPALAGNQQALGGNPAYGQSYQQSPYAFQNPYAHRPTSPHRSMYGLSQPRHDQPLHIVLFKCARADVFYIQEGTGLTVKPGDLVIVEADRGTDLGTVAREGVTWKEAKELKEHYAEEHYKWLMMYSQTAAATQEGAGAGLMAASNGIQGGTAGGMGPPSQHHMQEPGTGELKPKLIKRLAQAHEVHALRDKEGNEAKAKRVCMQKVKDHGLNMEILDAEFQMDWKKLTFYYFADAYINFNSLVTDLFKIYKTRIWMSAINPASFANHTLGLQAPSGIGPGAVDAQRSQATAARAQAQEQDEPTTYSSPPQAGRPFAGASNAGLGDRPAISPSAYQPQSQTYSYNTYGAYGVAPRPAVMPYGMVPGMDSYAGSYGRPADFQVLQARFPGSQMGGMRPEGTVSPIQAQADWTAAAFQGLSLGSR